MTVGNLTFDVRHCPGHTPGHVVFHHPESKLALVGDVLFKGSIGRWDFPRGNQQQLIRSITDELWPMGDDTAFVPGHGPMSTFGHERRDQSVRRRRGASRLAALRPAQTIAQIASATIAEDRGHHSDHPPAPQVRAVHSDRMRDTGEDEGGCNPAQRQRGLPPDSSSPPSRIRKNGAFSMKLACARMRLSTASLPPSPIFTPLSRRLFTTRGAEPDV